MVIESTIEVIESVEETPNDTVDRHSKRSSWQVFAKKSEATVHPNEKAPLKTE